MNFEDNDVIDEIRLHFNEICITSGLTVERLIGYAHDSEEHFYVFKDIDGQLSYYPATGAFTILKGITPDYDNIEKCFNLNESFPIEEMETISLEEEDEEDEEEDESELEDEDLDISIEEYLRDE